jgi:ComF family protein
VTPTALLVEVAQLLWPARCAACDAYVGHDDRVFCVGCAPSVCALGHLCAGCALPSPGATVDARCAACRRAPLPFVEAAAVLEYGEALAAAIIRMKHGGRRDLAARLARLLVVPLAELLARGGFDAGDAVVPVPLHARRLRQRGFNQALELARGALARLARRRGRGLARLPALECTLLRRKRATRDLGRAGPAARLAEVAGAFAVAAPARVRGRRVLLVDDVMTTGATFTACTTALLAAGAREVRVIALARAL